MNVRAEAIRYFEMGFGDKSIGNALGIPHDTVRRWLYTYRALGKEALFVTSHLNYSYETKLNVIHAVLEEGMPKPEVMKKFGIKCKTQINTWCRLYKEGGPNALLPKSKGRPKKVEPTFKSREEQLEARVRDLELENEILKRFNALAEGIEQK